MSLLIGEGETTLLTKVVAAPAMSCARDDRLDFEFRVSSDIDLFLMTVWLFDWRLFDCGSVVLL